VTRHRPQPDDSSPKASVSAYLTRTQEKGYRICPSGIDTLTKLAPAANGRLIMPKAPFILLVNPWITDFAAHDLWAKPMGLLLLGSLLRGGGCGVALIDCLDRHDPWTMASPDLLPGRDGAFGTGKYPRAVIHKPPVYAQVPRRYHRYGIHPESLTRQALELPKPDLVWVTSHMTYWYPGVFETIRHLKRVFPDVPLWLGGTYAILCRRHAETLSGADFVASGSLDELPCRIEAATGYRPANGASWSPLRPPLAPALDLLRHLPYAPLLTGLGCPYRCPYCASSILQPFSVKRSAPALVEEILRCHGEHGVQDFAFYDDALLVNADQALKPALERIARLELGLRFHTPNALHIRALSRQWCDLLCAAGFRTIRLGLETMRRDRQNEWGGKVETEMFSRVMRNLREAGLAPEDTGAYLMAGLPGQTVEEVRESIDLVREAGARPFICEYSPVPGTGLWNEACRLSPFELAAEPLTHNNTFLACRREDFTLDDLELLKAHALAARRQPRQASKQDADPACPPGPSARSVKPQDRDSKP
jgi:hypothetical protein